MTFCFPDVQKFKENSELTAGILPQNSVFTTLVDYNPTLVDLAKKDNNCEAENNIKGVVLTWEWVLSSDDNPNLPRDYKARYGDSIL